ncbi:contact-dependent growth inhibition system immunity protein [Trinickia mobilis]|uniref:contact-dependent growth inhibition system immunity protein n=1 Tax=Trinickia mobilis TaxID=2816356 RepID=UPI001A8E52CA|nr:contact-dependent growth inhibition system immunity protein [Trinickia mobilis]
MKTPGYPELNHLFGVYLNQDFDIWGDSLRDIIDCYKRNSPTEDQKSMLIEIDTFKKAHPTDLDEAFDAMYGHEFWPVPWGYTTDSFLEELKRLLQE